MPTNNRTDHFTRRGFISWGARAAATLGVLGRSNAAEAVRAPSGKLDTIASDLLPIKEKIALEEHFSIPETVDSSYAAHRGADVLRLIAEIGPDRIAEMDRGGVETCIISLVAPGIQGIPSASQAINVSRHANDYLAENIAKYPKRLKGFAALPLQDPQAASQELTRCIKELGFCGALVNGFSQIGEADTAVYYDLPQYRPFWATVEQLGVPLYLHPREPLPTRRQAYEGHQWLVSSAWGLGAETSIHALRLMGSGLFDEYPKLRVILGHLGECVPFGIWRVDHRIVKTGVRPQAKLPISRYLRENFYITTSGNFRTQALTDVITEVGADRVLYSVDYPFEDMGDAAEWFDHAPIAESDRVKIAFGNARQVFRL